MDSSISHKNTADAVKYCEATQRPYNLVKSSDYKTFLRELGSNETFVFFPKTPETLSRIVVEARMMGMGVIVNKLIGATQEPWYKLKGDELITHMHQKRETIKNIVVESLT